MQRVHYTYMFLVLLAGDVVASYRSKAEAERHAQRIGGSVSKTRY